MILAGYTIYGIVVEISKKLKLEKQVDIYKNSLNESEPLLCD